MKYGIYTMIAICLLSCIKENKGDTHIVEDTVWEIDFLDNFDTFYKTTKSTKSNTSTSTQEIKPVVIVKDTVESKVIPNNYEYRISRKVKDFIKDRNDKEGVCEIANDNADGQVIVSGDIESIKTMQSIFKEKKIKSFRFSFVSKTCWAS